MSGPEVVRIKRKRGEEAPDTLVVERRQKRNKAQDEPAEQQREHESVYVLQPQKEDGLDAGKQNGAQQPTQSLFRTDDVQRRAANSSPRPKSKSISGNGVNGGLTAAKERRTFHLKRPSTPEAGVKKRKASKHDKRIKDDSIATFVEKRMKKDPVPQAFINLVEREIYANEALVPAPTTEQTFKRTLASAVPGHTSSLAAHSRTTSRTEAIANSLHQFAVEEAAKESQVAKPKLTAMPKLSGQRSRALHQQRASQSSILSRTQDQDTMMEDDADYVYDTYVLAPSGGLAAAQVGNHSALGNVGYLVIGEEDEAVWETYMEEEASEEEPSDEDDENAEDWYGADYPDDELASDDEFDRGAYGYRGNRGSDDEEYDEHTFSEDEYDRQMNPWKKRTPQQFSKYFAGGEKKADDD